MRSFIGITACLLVLAVPATAGAAVKLSKTEARSVVDDVLGGDAFTDANPEADWVETYWVEPASRCRRFSRRVVECEFAIFGEEYEDPDTGEAMIDFCEGRMRVRETRRDYRWSDRSGDCGTIPAE